ncbi:MAG: polysaccharide biosynthesis tyrosine autokinase [Anaerolineae bacterium]
MEEEIDLRQYLFVLLQWWWLIVGCTILAALAAFTVSSLMRPVYRARTTLLIQKAPTPDVTDYTALLTSERLARTYVQMITGRPVLEATIAQLGLEETPEELASRVSVEQVRDTQLIRVSVEDTDPRRAALIADTLSEVFVAQIQAIQQQRYGESLERLQQQITELSGLIEETQRQIDALKGSNNAQDQAEQAQREVILAGYRNSYTTLIQNYERMRLTASQSADAVFLYEPAQIPPSPVRPRKLMNTAVAGVVGAMLAVGVVFLLEYLNDTIKTPDDIVRVASLSTLGVIGQLPKGQNELIVQAEPLSPLAEAFRTLRTNIRYASVDRPLRVLLVTSPVAMSGKTFVVTNLAAVMAQAGLRTVLVDADLRRPRLHNVFEVHPMEGLLGSLLEGGGMDSRLQPTAVEGLLLLPAGGRPPNPTELVGSARMRELLQKIGREADIVLVDSPPVLPVADTIALAGAVDGVLLVTKAGVTRRPAFQQTVEALQRVGANIIGVVINAVPVHGRGYYYYGYHYYYSEHYYGEGERRKKRSRSRSE